MHVPFSAIPSQLGSPIPGAVFCVHCGNQAQVESCYRSHMCTLTQKCAYGAWPCPLVSDQLGLVRGLTGDPTK